MPEIDRTIAYAVERGVRSYKLFTAYKKRGMQVDDPEIIKVMESVVRHGGLLAAHCENGAVIDWLEEKALAAGQTHPRYFADTHPELSEAEALFRFICLAKMTGCPIYLPHLTTRQALEVLALARSWPGPPIFAETCPHYLSLTGDLIEQWGTRAKVTPPIRRAGHAESLWAAVADGRVEVVGSDHAGHSSGVKEPHFGNVYASPTGIPGGDMLLRLMYNDGVARGRLTLPDLARVLCENPARIFGLWPRKGGFNINGDADLVIWDPEAETVAEKVNPYLEADYNLYEGRRLMGRPDMVVRRGQVIFEDGEVIGKSGGRVAEAAADINPDLADQCFPVEGLTLMPGVIDTHIHASSWLGGPRAHAMMARAGVCTALDMSGPTASVLDYAVRYGRGLNLAVLEYVRPGHTVNSDDPDRDELGNLLDKSLAAGAIGLKILGGHYPLSPEATRTAIEIADARGAYLAFHAGTTATRSDLTGLREVFQLLEGRSIHLAHINSYCRGRVRPYMEETEEAITLLNTVPHIFSESYLSAFNGTSGLIVDGRPESQVTVNCLSAKGSPISANGLKSAVMDGWARVNQETDEEVVLSQGPAAVDYWLAKDTDVTLSFAVNPPEPRIRLAAAKNEKYFVVKALSTDGGGIPRNVTVEMGLALVKLKALTLQEFVLKASTAPAWALGQSAVGGHLGPGTQADVTGLDMLNGKATLTVVGGRVIMRNAQLTGTGTNIITTKQGETTVRRAGLTAEVLDLESRPFYDYAKFSM